MENVDDNFINQLRCLIEEYGYQLPMETEKDTSFSFDRSEEHSQNSSHSRASRMPSSA